MKNRYTADEMREMALVEESYGWDVVAKMLRQAADIMEGEDREKKYEYSVVLSGFVSPMHDEDYPSTSGNIPIVRREVGEWEEVKNV